MQDITTTYLGRSLTAQHSHALLKSIAQEEGRSLSSIQSELNKQKKDADLVRLALKSYYSMLERGRPLQGAPLSQMLVGNPDVPAGYAIARVRRLLKSVGESFQGTLWRAPNSLGNEHWWFAGRQDAEVFEETYKVVKALSSQFGAAITPGMLQASGAAPAAGTLITQAVVEHNAARWQPVKPALLSKVFESLVSYAGAIELKDLRGALIRLATMREYQCKGVLTLTHQWHNSQIIEGVARHQGITVRGATIYMNLASRVDYGQSSSTEGSVKCIADILTAAPGRSLSRAALYDVCQQRSVALPNIRSAVSQHFLFDTAGDQVRLRGFQ